MENFLSELVKIHSTGRNSSPPILSAANIQQPQQQPPIPNVKDQLGDDLDAEHSFADESLSDLDEPQESLTHSDVIDNIFAPDAKLVDEELDDDFVRDFTIV